MPKIFLSEMVKRNTVNTKTGCGGRMWLSEQRYDGSILCRNAKVEQHSIGRFSAYIVAWRLLSVCSQIFRCVSVSLAPWPTPVSWLFGHLHFQISLALLLYVPIFLASQDTQEVMLVTDWSLADFTDVTLVSEDAFWKLDWCDSGEWWPSCPW